MAKNNKNKKEKSNLEQNHIHFPPKLIGLLAEEVSKTVVERLPSLVNRPKKKAKKQTKKIESAVFLDTSAIIDGRIFNIINMGLIVGVCVVLEPILLELKHIADSQDTVKRERGRKGLELLEKIKKVKGVKLEVVSPKDEKKGKPLNEVDEELIRVTKQNKGRIITCDYNLAKKANIEGVQAININTLANYLKVTAVPGEALHVKILHKGKDVTQGVGYLDDGTMIVVESGSGFIEQTVDVVVSRVIQTPAGRILFAKKLS